MKKFKVAVLFGIFGLLLATLYTNCSDSFSAASSSSVSGGALPLNVNLTQNNVMAVTTGCGYVNEPCVTVTICVPGTSNCQSINNVLLDTGSYGLRLFSQVSLDNFQTLTPLIALPMETDPNNSSNQMAECVSYADGSSDWGPVGKADVQLGGGELASSVPIQVINSGFATLPSGANGCSDPDQSPLDTGFNGILGVGLFTQDCGDGCVTDSNNYIYYSCSPSSGGACSPSAARLALQVANPVASLPVDNNGVILALPSLSDAGAVNVSGFLVFGIGTETNNIPVGANTFYADGYGNFGTVFNGITSTSSFIDSGSNGLYFPDNSLTQCSGNDAGFYCPPSQMSLSAVQQSADGSVSVTVPFNIANADNELSSSNPNLSFNNLGGSMSSDFDWGLPFFYGRTVFVGIDSGSSSLGYGPLWAY